MIKINMNTTGFFRDIEEEQKAIYEKIILIIKKVAFDFFGKVIKESPVDTGRLRSSWVVVAESDISPDVIEINKNEGQATSIAVKRLGKIEDFQLGDIIRLVNNVEYSIYVEFGAPKKSTTAMIRLNSQEMREVLNEAIRKLNAL